MTLDLFAFDLAAPEFKLDDAFIADFVDKPVKWGPVGLVTYKRTYSRQKPDGTSEEWYETVRRVVEGTYQIQQRHCEMNDRSFNVRKAQRSAQRMYRMIFDFKFTPPGRGLAMMGTDHVRKNGAACLNNCGFTTTRDISSDFAEPFCWLMDMSMLGVGVGSDVRGAGSVVVDAVITKGTFKIPDTREGWVAALRELLDGYAFMGTIPAFDYSEIRPYGAPIKGFGGVSSGPDPLRQLLEVDAPAILDPLAGKSITKTAIVDLCNVIGKCVVSGNVRRSAEIMFGDYDDEEFMDLKNPELHKVEMDSHRWASNNSIFAKLGMDYAAAASRTGRNGEPGYIWLENIQRYGRMIDPPNNLDHRVMGTNPCITGDTLIFTGDGPRRADELYDSGALFTAVVDGAEYQCNSGVFKTGTKPVYLVQTKEGHSVKVTADHKILTSPKCTPKKRYEEWVPASELSAGDKIILNNTRKVSSWPGQGSADEGWMLGMLVGDGHFHQGSQTCKLQFWGEHKQELLDYALPKLTALGGDPRYHARRTGTSVESRDMLSVGSRRLWDLAPTLGVNRDKTLDAAVLLQTSSDFQRGFLRGIFDADGSVQGTQTKGISVRLGSVSLSHLEAAQRMLLNLGVNSTIYQNRRAAGQRLLPDGKGGRALYNCQTAHELVISKDNLSVFQARVGFAEPSKESKLTAALQGYNRNLNRDRFLAEVASVTLVGAEDVYDCTVDEVHRFGADGIVVHNCVEQSLEHLELCTLVETYPGNHNSYLEYQETLKMAYLYAKVVTLVPTHYAGTNKVMARNRRIGLSQSGIVQSFAKHGRRQHLKWCDNGYRFLGSLDHQYSEWLGVNRSIKRTSVKPSGTVSKLAGVTAGMHYPPAEHYIQRIRFAEGSELLDLLRKAGYPNEPDVYAGDQTIVVEFPVKEKHFIKAESDVSLWEQLSVAAQLQRWWADNQVSCTIKFDSRDPALDKEIEQCQKVVADYKTALAAGPAETSELVDWDDYSAYLSKQIAAFDNMITDLQTRQETNIAGACEEIGAALELFEDQLKGISFLPSAHGYAQAPWEPITAAEYDRRAAEVDPRVVELGLKGQDVHDTDDQFCDGGVCSLPVAS